MFAIRIPFAAVGGALCSIAIFLGLAQLVGTSFEMAPARDIVKIDFTPKRVDTPIESKRDEKIVRELPTPVPAGPRIVTDDFGDEGSAGGFHYTRPELDTTGGRGGIDVGGLDGEPIPRVRVNPDYPPRAALAGIEGWVQVEYTVTAIGTVRDVTVVASEPGTVFDEAALKAVARWRYNPRVENGMAVERPGLQTVIRFELEEQR
jgi:protein TonB